MIEVDVHAVSLSLLVKVRAPYAPVDPAPGGHSQITRMGECLGAIVRTVQLSHRVRNVKVTRSSWGSTPGAATRTIYERRFKRPLDVVGASLLCAMTAPVQAFVAVGVLVNHGRPIIFRQPRIGLNGEAFVMLKFKSMREAAPERRPSQRFHTDHDDDRHTKFGRFIRRFSIDELPQLINVLRGEMSLIGPRPELPDVCDSYGLLDHPRHSVRPGMTGPWQISANRHTFVHLNTHLDTEYVGELTFRRDLMIAIRTIGVLLVGKRRPRLHQDDAIKLSTGDRPLRVLHVLEPAIAGVPAYVDQLGRLLRARGVDQMVITASDSSWPFEDWCADIVRMDWSRNRPADTVAVAESIRHLADAHEIDIVHAHSTFAGIAARLRSHPARVVYQPHGWGHLSTQAPLARLVVRRLERLMARRTDLLLTLSRHEDDGAPPGRRAGVGPLSDLSGFTVAADWRRLGLRHELGWRDDETIHVCVGELSARKNQTELVETWIADAPSKHRLVLLGSGKVRPVVPPAATTKVTMLGWRDDIAQLMQAADSLVVASRGEGFSLTILEALGTGLPVFTTDVGGAESVGPDDGAVCKSVPDVVAAATSSPLTGPGDERRARARRHRYAVDGVVDEIVALYESLFQSRSLAGGIVDPAPVAPSIPGDRSLHRGLTSTTVASRESDVDSVGSVPAWARDETVDPAQQSVEPRQAVAPRNGARAEPPMDAQTSSPSSTKLLSRPDVTADPPTTH